MKPLTNITAERAVLAGICQYGQDIYFDVCDLLQESTFTVEYNQRIYACINHIFKHSEVKELDIALIFSAAEEIGLSSFLQTHDCAKHLHSLFTFSIIDKNIRQLAAKIRKLEITRLLRKQLGTAQDSLLEINGSESIANILGIAENAIFDFSSLINQQDEEPKAIHENLLEYIQYLSENPVDQLGIPTRFPNYDRAIGGGLRPGTVNVLAARIKVGKSLLGSNIGFNIAKEKIPVLNLDTELTYEDHLNRLLAMYSKAFIYDIETGKFSQQPHSAKRVKDAAIEIEKEKIPYYHKSIAGMPFEEQLAIMRRWIIKNVGLNTDGTSKKCVLVYDYLKLMTAENLSGALQEYQMLGFMMTTLHNFAVRYRIPILLFIQLNRDGITKESTDTASGSDRVLWLCSNFTLFKPKSEEEISADGPENGNRKLVTLVARHGAGTDPGDYINCFFRGSIGEVVEGKTKFQIEAEKKNADTGVDC